MKYYTSVNIEREYRVRVPYISSTGSGEPYTVDNLRRF